MERKSESAPILAKDTMGTGSMISRRSWPVASQRMNDYPGNRRRLSATSMKVQMEEFIS